MSFEKETKELAKTDKESTALLPPTVCLFLPDRFVILTRAFLTVADRLPAF